MAKKTTKTASPNILVQNITVKPTTRNSIDIKEWREAIKAFEKIDNPLRTKLYDLYSDVILDGHLEAVWGKRQDAITNKELVFFTNDGETDEEINKILNCPDMRGILKELHNSIAWGYTLIQVNSINYNEDEERYEIDWDLIPRKHVHPEPDFQCISQDQNQVTRDILYKEPPLAKYMMWAGDPTDMGLFIKAAQYVIYKRGNFGDWAQFAELFGMPFREARYDDYDDETRRKLEHAMEYYGSAAFAILPKSADFKLHDAVKGTAGALYDLLHKACNAEISKSILGNTLTTEQGDSGARSLGEVHKDVEDAKHISDIKYITDIIDTKFKSILKLFGYDVSGGHIWFKSGENDWDLMSKKWSVLSGLSRQVPISDDYIYQEFDIPKPDDYDALKKKMEEDRRMLHPANLKIPVVGELTETERKTILGRITDFFV